jgi:hypothetical protein
VVFKLPSSVYSPALIESVVYETGEYLDWYREARVHKTVGAKAAEEPSFTGETVQTIEAWFDGKKPTVTGIEQLLTHLRGLDLPVVHVTMAALPNHTQRASLVDWFRVQVSPDVLIAFVADRNLGGGVMVRTPNHVFDYSWRQKLVAGRDKLAGIIKNV